MKGKKSTIVEVDAITVLHNRIPLDELRRINMDKVEQLLIRACLARNPRKRLMSVRRRFYISCPQDTMFLAVKLSMICDKYMKISVTEVIEGLEPIVGRDIDFYSRAMMFCVHKIRHSKKSLFPGLTPPLEFRK